MTYAADTSVSVEKSRAQIEGVLARYGASSFSSGWRDAGDGTMEARLDFVYNRRAIRFGLTFPSRDSDEVRLSPAGRERSRALADKAWEQLQRQRWRALYLVVKAKLEAIEVGISSFDVEFMPWLVLPDGRTVHEHAVPAIQAAIDSGRLQSADRLLGFGDA